jgi:hypothetical protein
MFLSFRSRASCALWVAALLFAGPAPALDIHSAVEAPPSQILAVSDFATTGAEMAGMEVTALFSNADPETVTWQATGLDSGGAFGLNQDWSLTQSGDTFAAPWTLLYEGSEDKGLLIGFDIDGMAAGTGEIGVMFDRTFGFQFGTQGSFHGWDYETLTDVPFDTLITFRSAIALPGESPVGDLFRYLEVRFADRPPDEFSGFGIGGLDGVDVRSVSFRQDTDNNVIPEPATATLLLLGAGVVYARRRLDRVRRSAVG